MKSEINKNNIKEVTKKLIISKGYNNVNISEISKLTNIKRGAIYNYYKVKEDIYLDIVIDEFYDYIDLVKEGLGSNKGEDAFINLLVDNIVDKKELLILQSIMLPIIEPNASLESLVNFKINISKFFEEFYAIFNNVYPQKTNEEILENIIMFISSISGLYPMTITTDKQDEAIRLGKIAYEKVDFKITLRKALYKVFQ